MESKVEREFLPSRSGVAFGINKGHKTTRLAKPKKAFHDSQKVKFVRELISEVAGFAPYEKRIMEYIKSEKERRARKFAKERLGGFTKGKNKVEKLRRVLDEMRRASREK